MSDMNGQDIGDACMLDLFRSEVEAQSEVLTRGLLALERDLDVPVRLEELMRAAHSLKGAARIVGRNVAVRIAHGMEDCFVACQKQKRRPSGENIDALLAGVDLLSSVARLTNDDAFGRWEDERRTEVETFLASLSSVARAVSESSAKHGEGTRSAASVDLAPEILEKPEQRPILQPAPVNNSTAPNRTLRIATQNLDSLMGLAGEALLTSRWLDGFAAEMRRLKKLQRQLGRDLDGFRDALPVASLDARAAGRCSRPCRRVPMLNRRPAG